MILIVAGVWGALAGVGLLWLHAAHRKPTPCIEDEAGEQQ